MTPHFASVVLDVDSTVSGIEGIDWLAERRGAETAARIAALTDEAMRGLIPLESVYGARLTEIRPRRQDIDRLSIEYIKHAAPHCVEVVKRMREAGVRVVLVSGGIRQAIVPLAAYLGVPASDLHAVDARFDADGDYAGFDDRSPLATSNGKRVVVEGLGLPRPILAVGDGSTDVAMKSVVDGFGAFTGFAARQAVVGEADVVIESFIQLATLVLG